MSEGYEERLTKIVCAGCNNYVMIRSIPDFMTDQMLSKDKRLKCSKCGQRRPIIVNIVYGTPREGNPFYADVFSKLK